MNSSNPTKKNTSLPINFHEADLFKMRRVETETKKKVKINSENTNYSLAAAGKRFNGGVAQKFTTCTRKQQRFYHHQGHGGTIHSDRCELSRAVKAHMT